MFDSKSKTSVDLSKKVDNVLNAFKTAIDGLKEVNASAELEIAARDEEIKAAQAEKKLLKTFVRKTKVFLQN